MPAGAGAAFPIVRARNVYVLPGVPELLRRKWQARPCPGDWPGVPELLRRKWQARPCPGGWSGAPELLRRKWQPCPCPGGWPGVPKLLRRKWQACPCPAAGSGGRAAMGERRWLGPPGWTMRGTPLSPTWAA